jgi:hypothetical protein
MQFFTDATTYGNGSDRGGIRKKTAVNEVEFVAASDIRIKFNINDTTSEDFLGPMSQLRLVRATMKGEKANVKQPLFFLAQNVNKFYPDKVYKTDDGIQTDDKGNLPKGIEPWRVGSSWEKEIVGCIKQLIKQDKERDDRISRLEACK